MGALKLTQGRDVDPDDFVGQTERLSDKLQLAKALSEDHKYAQADAALQQSADLLIAKDDPFLEKDVQELLTDLVSPKNTDAARIQLIAALHRTSGRS